ncbi:MAG TPA: glyoxalase superfamily protein [Pyrinomonadaceae bacterium]|nr:glyoxalase superfamily protein [Pyrinomonadaceae bacterium]
MGWTRVAPVYPVADVSKAIEWYGHIFGFEVRVVNPPDDPLPVYAVLYRDEVSLHLLRADEAPYGLAAPMQAQFWVNSDVDALFERAELLGVKVLQRPDDRPWGHRDFMVADPDGNIVWVTTPIGEVGKS